MNRLNGMADIDVVIVNYRSAPHAVNCMRAVHGVANGDGVNVHIFVINNGDDDVAFDQTLQAAGAATIANNASNVGFGAACNQGAALGTANFILFLNPDVTLQPGTLRTCLEAFDDPAQENLGVIGPEIVDGDGNLVCSCSRLPMVSDLIFRSMGGHTIVRNTGYPFLPRSTHERSGDVGQVMGAALFVRRSLFRALGGFDERLFLYYEDVDLCTRAYALGSRCHYLKSARVVHIGRVSSSQDTGLALALHIRSRLIYTRLHFGPGPQLLLAAISVLFELPFRLLQALFGGGAIGGRGVLRAYRLLLFNALPNTGLRAPNNTSHGAAA